MSVTEMGTSIRKIIRLAALLFAFGALAPHAMAAGKSVDTATDEDRAGASEMYQRANSAFAEGRLDDALQGFKDSYDIVASPNSLFMVVRTLQDMGRLAEAYRAAPEVTRLRLHLDTAEELLAGRRKVILDRAAEGSRRRLFLGRQTWWNPSASLPSDTTATFDTEEYQQP